MATDPARKVYTAAELADAEPCRLSNAALETMLTQAAARARVLEQLRIAILQSPPDRLYSWRVWIDMLDDLLAKEGLQQ